MTTQKVAKPVLRWTARIIGALLVGLVVLFAVGEGVRLQDFNAVTGSMMVAFLVSLAGMLVLWRWELIGGVMVLIGMGGFYAIEYISSGDLPGGWVLPVCFLPGVLALASWAIERGKKSTADSTQVPAHCKPKKRTPRPRKWPGCHFSRNARFVLEKRNRHHYNRVCEL